MPLDEPEPNGAASPGFQKMHPKRKFNNLVPFPHFHFYDQGAIVSILIGNTY